MTSMAPRQRVQIAALCIGYWPLDPQQPPRNGGAESGTTGGAEIEGLLAVLTLPDLDKKMVKKECT